jgi:hypothetical protein
MTTLVKILIFTIIIFSVTLASEKRVYTSGDWNNPAIWSPVGVPTADDTVWILHDISNESAIFVFVRNADAICKELILDTAEIGSTLEISEAKTLTVLGSVTVKGFCQFGNDGGSINVAGDWRITGVFDAGDVSSNNISTITFNGAGDQFIDASTFAYLIIQNSGGTVTLNGSIVIKENISILSGIFDIKEYTADRATVGGTFFLANNAKLNAGGSFPTNYTTISLGTSSTVNYNSTGGFAQQVARQTYGNLILSGTSSKTVQDTFVVAGNFIIDGVSLTGGNNKRHHFRGNWSQINGGLYNITTSIGNTVIFDGSANQQIIGADKFRNLTVAKSAGTLTLNSNVTILNGDVRLSQGTFDLQSSTLNRSTPGGIFTVSDGGYLLIGGTNSFPSNYNTVSLSSGSTIAYNGDIQSIRDLNYGNLYLSGTGNKTTTGDLNITGNFSVTTVSFTSSTTVNFSGTSVLSGNGFFNFHNVGISGVLTDSGRTLNVNGNWSNSGIFNTSGKVDFNGDNQSVSNSSFHDILFSTAGIKTLSDSIIVFGNWTNNATVVPPTYTIFSGNRKQILTDATTIFTNLEINKSSDTLLSVTDIAIQSFKIKSGHFNDGGKTIFLSGNLQNTGSYNGTGTISFSGNNSLFGGGKYNFGNVVYAGNLSDGGDSINVSGNWIKNNAGNFSPAGIVNFNGSSAQIINGTNFYHIIFSNSGIKTIAQSHEITGDINFGFGTNVILGAFTHSIFGNWIKHSSATIDVTGATINFNGLDPQTISASNFNHLVFSQAGLKNLAGNISVLGNLTIQANAFLNGGLTDTIIIRGNWINNGTFIPSSSAVLFAKKDTSLISGIENLTVNNLIIADSAVLKVTAGKKIILQGELSENGYLFGDIEKTERLFFAGFPYTFGNIGAEIAFLNIAPDTTTVLRSVGTVADGFESDQAVKRIFYISSKKQPSNATIIFSYRTSELNTQIEDDLTMWRSNIGSSIWEKQKFSTPDPANNTVTETKISKFSRWTFSSTKVRRFVPANGNWNVSSNWNPIGVPTNADSVLIADEKFCTIANENAEVGSLNIEGTLTIDDSETLHVARHWIRPSGGATTSKFIPAAGVVIFDDDDEQSIDATDFYNLHLKGNGTKTVTEGFSIEKNITIDANTTFDGKTFDFTVGGNWINNGAFASNGTSKVTFNSVNLAQNISSGTFNHIVFEGGGIKTATGNIDITGNITINANATFVAGNFTHSVGGNWIKGGSFTATGSTIIFDGSVPQSLSASNFENVIFTGSGVKTANGVISVLGNLSIENGCTFNASVFPNVIGGNWKNDGSFLTSGSFEFTGENKVITGNSQTIFHTLLISGTIIDSSNIRINDNFTVSGSFTQVNGTTVFGGATELDGVVNLKNVTINNDKILRLRSGSSLGIAGSFSILGQFDAITNSPTTVEFNGGAQSIPSATYDNITITNGNVKTAANSLIIAGEFTIDNATSFSEGNSTVTLKKNLLNNGTYQGGGTIRIQDVATFSGNGNFFFNNLSLLNNADTLIANNIPIFVAGSYSNFGTFISNNTITFNGNGNQNIIANSFHNAVFTGSGIKSLINATGMIFTGNVTINAVTVAGSVFDYVVKGNWTNTGIFTSGGTVHFRGVQAQSISGGQFYNIAFNDSGAKTLTASLVVQNNLLIDTNAVLIGGNLTHRVGGSWSNYGNFITTASTKIIFNGSNQQNISSGKFSTIEFSGTGTKIANGALTVLGSIIIDSNATFTGGNFTHTVGESWYNFGTFNANGGTIQFTKTDTAEFVGNTSLNNVIINIGTFLRVENADTIFLKGSLIENGYIIGAIARTENMNSPLTNYTFGNMGAIISYSGFATPGNTQVVRITGSTPPGFAGDDALTRYYSITSFQPPSTGATITLHYSEDLDIPTGQSENDLHIWKGNTNGMAWLNQKNSTIAVATNTVELTGISEFSLYAISSNSVRTFNVPNGSWMSTANWSPRALPTNTDSVHIPFGKIVTLADNDSAICNGLFIDGSVVAANSSVLNIYGNWYQSTSLSFNAGLSTIQFVGDNQYISSAVFGNVKIAGTGKKYFLGEIQINGNINISINSTLELSNFQYTFKGNWENKGAISPSNSTAIFSKNGTASFIGNSLLYNITVNDGTILDIQSGDTATYLNNLSESGYIIGAVRRTQNVSSSIEFYSFGNIGATINFNGVAPMQTTIVRTTGRVPLGFDITQAVKREFHISSQNNPSNASLTLAYDSSEINDLDASTMKLWRSTNNGISWIREPSSSSSENSATISGLTSFSKWAFSSTQIRKMNVANGVWDVTTDWSPTGLPTSTDSVVIPVEHKVSIPVNYLATVGSLNNLGELTMTSGTLTVKRNWLRGNNSVFNSGNGTVVFNGTEQNISGGNFASVLFSNGGIKKVSGNIVIADSLHIDENTTLNISLFSCSVGGNWSNAGQLISSGVINFNGNNLQTISVGKFNDVIFSGNGNKKLYGTLSFHNVTINSVVDGGTSIDSVTGDWNNNGVFLSSGVVVFNSSSQQNISQSEFNNIAFVGNGIKTAIGSLTISGNATFYANAHFNAGNFEHYVGGNWTKNAESVFNASLSTIHFNGSASQIITASNFYNIHFEETGEKSAFGSLTIEGDVEIESNFDGGDFSHLVRGNWNQTGTFYANRGKVIFENNSEKTFIGNVEFNTLQINSSSKIAIQENSSITLQDSLIENGYVSGTIIKSQRISSSGVTYLFGGIGAEIYAPDDSDTLGLVTIQRKSGSVPPNFDSLHAVQRWYKIISTERNSSHVEFSMSYNNAEQNEQPDSLIKFWRSNDNEISWKRIPQSNKDAHANTVSYMGIDSNTSWSFSAQSGRTLSKPTGSWTDSTVWSPGGIPTSADSVFIPAGTVITLDAGHNAAIGSINIDGTLTIAGSDTLFVYGNWNNSGIFSAGNGTVVFDSSDQYLGKGTFHNLLLRGTGAKELRESLVVTKDFSIHGVDFNDNGNVVHIGGNLSLASSFNGIGTTIFDGNTTISTAPNSTLQFHNIRIEGTLDDGGNTLSVAGDWINTGTFITTGVVNFNNTDTQTVSAGNFNQIEIDKQGGIFELSGDVTMQDNFTLTNGIIRTNNNNLFVSGDMILDGGILNAGNSSISVKKDWIHNATNFLRGNSTVVFDANASQSISPTGFHNLSFQGSGTKTASGDLEIFGKMNVGNSPFSDGAYTITVHGDLRVASNYFGTGTAVFASSTTLQGNGLFTFRNVTITGTLNDSSKDISVRGDWTNSGIFTASGTVKFDGVSAQQIYASNFNTIIFSNAGNKIANGNMSISGNLQLDSGATFIGNNFTHTIGGNWSKHTGGIFIADGTTIQMNGNTPQNISASNFNNLTLLNAGEKLFAGDVHIEGDFDNQSSCNAGNYFFTFDSDFINSGTLNPETSTFLFTQNGIASFSGNTTTVNNLTIQDSTVLNIPKAIKIIINGKLTEEGNGYIKGRIEKTENVSIPDTLYSFGNIGVEMKFASQPPGITKIERITDESAKGFDSVAVIKRTYSLSASNNSSDDTVQYHYSRIYDLNGQTEPQLKLWTSPDSGKHWTKLAQSIKHPLNTFVTITGIDTTQFITMSSSGVRLFSNTLTTAFWNDSSKWSPKGLPTKNDSVVIPAGLTCVIPSNFDNAECGDVTILNSGTLTFVGNDTLRVYGDWKNNGTFSVGAGTIFLEGNNQTINSSQFHHLIIGGSGTKTAIGTITVGDTMEIRSGVFADGGDSVTIKGTLIVNSNYNGSGALIFLGNTKLSGNGTKSFGDVRIEGESILNDNGVTYNITKNWNTIGTFTATGTAIFSGNGNTQIITSPNFYNIVFTGTSAKSITGNVNIANNLTIDSNSSFVSGGHLVTVGGDWINNGTFTSAGNGNVTLAGISKKIDGTAVTPFNNLTVTGSISTTKSFDVVRNLNVTGVLRQTQGNVVFGFPSVTSAISGNAQLKNVSIPMGNLLRLNAGAVLGIAGTLSYNNNFDATLNPPTRIEINGDANQTIPAGNYCNLVVKNGNIKTAGGYLKILDTLTIDTLTTFSDGGDSTEFHNVIINRGKFAGSGSAVFYQTNPRANLIGTGLFDFNHLTIGSNDTLVTDNLIVHVHGNFSNNGRLISTGKFIFDGLNDQIISRGNFHNIEMAGRGTKTATGIFFIEKNLYVNDSVVANFSSFMHRMKGNIVSQGRIDSAKIVFYGDSLQTIYSADAILFDKIVVDKNQNNIVLFSDIHIADSLRLIRGDCETNAHRIFLDTNSHLVESPNNTVLGTVIADRVLTVNTNNSFNGIGIEFLAKNTAPGRTVITRRTGTSSTFNGVGGFSTHSSLPRSFDVQPTMYSNLNATIKVHYNDPSEFSGQDEKTFRIWVSRDSADSWYGYTRSLLSDSTQNFVVAESVMNISRNTLMTLADNLNALQSNVIFARAQRISDTLLISDSMIVPKQWSLSIRKNSPSGILVSTLSSADSLVVQDSIEDGTYYVMQSDSTLWRHFAYRVNGSLFISSSNAVPVVVSGGTRTNVEFLNFHPNKFTIRHWFDKDSNLATNNDRVLIPWGYTVSNSTTYHFTEATANWSIDQLADGTYLVEQKDSVGWTPLGYKINGNLIADTSRNVTVVVNDGDDVLLEFFIYPTQEMYLSFTPQSWKIKPHKLSTHSSDAMLPIHQPTIGNITDSVFTKIFTNKHYGLTLGIPKPTDTLAAKKLAFISLRGKGESVRQFITHTGSARGFDKLVGFYRNPKFQKELNNKLVAEVIALKMNIAMSDAKISPSGFGEIIYVSGDPSNVLEKKTLREISRNLDTALTYWKFHTINNVSDTNYYNSLYASLKNINSAFDIAINGSDFDTTNGIYSPLKVKRIGKLLYEIPFLQKNIAIDSFIVDTIYTLPTSYRLYQNYPNPFNATTYIPFDLPYEAKVTLEIYDVLGRKVATVLKDEIRAGGPDEISFDASQLASGIYFYRITATATDAVNFTGDYYDTRKFVLIK